MVERSRGLSLDVGGLLELKSQFTREYAYSYKITGKADYLAFYEGPKSEAFLWTWKDL